MLEFIYSIIGCLFVLCGIVFVIVSCVCKILTYRKIRIIRLGMESCYAQGYKDAQEGKDFNPPKHITIEQ